jgi:hypothetical protein
MLQMRKGRQREVKELVQSHTVLGKREVTLGKREVTPGKLAPVSLLTATTMLNHEEKQLGRVTLPFPKERR